MITNTYIKKRDGIGSMFHDIALEAHAIDSIPIEMDYTLFYTGRQAVKYILETIKENHNIEKIWMPSYYCQHVTRWIKKVYTNLHFYDINPFEFHSAVDVNSFASKNDVVLINNYWGLSDGFTKTADSPIIIEDHSHGWLTKNCMNSKADYCFVSLRKTLPIPLGGICWKPNAKMETAKNHFIDDPKFYEVFDRLHLAMKAKYDYKNGATQIEKVSYLKAMEDTEDFLDVNHEIISVRPQDVRLLETYLSLDFLSHKARNLELLYKQLEPTPLLQLVKRPEHTSFGLLLLLKEQHLWASLRKQLIANDIYPSFLWPDNKSLSELGYVLNVHVDFRYNAKDMVYIANTINDWIRFNTKA